MQEKDFVDKTKMDAETGPHNLGTAAGQAEIVALPSDSPALSTGIPGIDGASGDLAAESISARFTGPARRAAGSRISSLVGADSRPLGEVVQQLGRIIASPEFHEIAKSKLVDELQPRLDTPPSRSSSGGTPWDQRLLGGADQFVRSLQTTLPAAISQAISPIGAEIEAGRLKREELDLGTLFERKQIWKMLRPAFVESLRAVGVTRENAISGAMELAVPAVRTAIENSAVIIGESAPFSARARAIVSLRSLELPYIDREGERQLARSKDFAGLLALRDFIGRVDELPDVPLVTAQHKQWAKINEGFRRDLTRSVVARGGPDALDEELLGVLSRLFRDPRVEIYLHETGNQNPLFTRIREGISQGALTLRAMSCPDYSATTVAGPNGAAWSFDFKRLGTSPGVVMQKAFDFMEALVGALKPSISAVRVEHFEPTFEVAAGFDGKQEVLDRDEALHRLRQSNLAIAGEFGRRGIETRTALFSDLIEDHHFERLKAEVARDLVSRLETDARLLAIRDAIFQRRSGLYNAWHRRVDEGEGTFQARIKSEIIPLQMAEFMIFGPRLTQEPATVLVTYDSSIMGEVHAWHGIPVIFGQTKGSRDYVGAGG